MSERLISAKDLRGFFNVDDRKLNEYFDWKVKQGYSSRHNSYPGHTCQLIETYIQDISKFRDKLNTFHDEIIIKLNAEIEKYNVDTKYEDHELAMSIFDTNRDRAHVILAAKISLERVKDELSRFEPLYDTQFYEGTIHFYSKLLFDIQTLFGNCGRRTQQSPDMEIFQCSKNLLRNYSYYSAPIIPTTIILIRQCIEAKLLQTMGVRQFLYNDGTQAVVGVSKLIDFFELLEKQGRIISPVKFELISKINKWCNHYVHTGDFSDYIWDVEWMHYIITPLFSGGQDNYIRSLERSIYIDKNYFEKSFHVDLEKFISRRNKKISVKTVPIYWTA